VLISGAQNGSVTVKAGGALEITGSVNGSVSATGAAQLALCGSRSNGSVTSTGATGLVFIGGGICTPTQLNGSVTITGGTGGVRISGSTINGSLTCKTNTPAPTDGGLPNKVGSRSGQCATPVNF
jgi:hypothetical protein